MSKADRLVPARDPVQSSAGARRTARGFPGSDSVPSARATADSPLCLLPESTAAAGIHSPRSRWGQVRYTVWIHPPGADPGLPTAEFPEASACLRLRVAPAVAGIHDSSALHWAAST